MQLHHRSRPNSRALVHVACLLFACCDANWCLNAGSADADPSTSSESSSSETSSTETSSTETTGPDLCGNDKCDAGEAQSCPGDCEGCGDGSVAGSEECDDGNADNTDDCTDSCTQAVCGDGYVQASVETCDDGKDNSAEGWTPAETCKSDCKGFTDYCGDGTCQTEFEDAQSCAEDSCAAVCGNGKVEGDEPCDDGNDDDTDACLSDCKAATCGDGFVRTGVEDCDDANGENTDECLNSCAKATCGDGFVQEGVEACDDDNDIETDDCDSACNIIEHRRVFVSSMKYEGDFGGLMGNNICQVLGGGPNYKAWLSDAASGPADSFDTNFTGVYELTNGEFLAKGWADLTDGELAHAIDQTEAGTTVPSSAVWTNTLADGTPLGALDCVGWSDNTLNEEGSFGASNVNTTKWTNNEKSQACSSPARIYCFEDG